MMGRKRGALDELSLVLATVAVVDAVYSRVTTRAHHTMQCERHFLIMDNSTGIQLYTYEGRQICNPKFQGGWQGCGSGRA